MSGAAQAGRYARQEVFPGIGAAGQARLARARVAVVGCGALGTHLAEHLARAGVGHLILIDRDIVEWSNLQRQTLFDEADAAAGAPKALAAAARLRQVNSAIAIEPRVQDLAAEEARELAAEVDLVLDGTDSFATRYVINDACVAAGIPWIYSAVVGAYGTTLNCHVSLGVGRTPCLRCIWPDPAAPGTAETCDVSGVVNGAVSVVTGLAATEALKILLGDPAVSAELRTFDLWDNIFDTIALPRDPACPCCAQGEYPWLEGEQDFAATTLCGRDTVQVRPARRAALDLAVLAARWSMIGAVDLPGVPDQAGAVPGGSASSAFARLRLDQQDITVFPDGRALIRGVADEATARSLYARYVGM